MIFLTPVLGFTCPPLPTRPKPLSVYDARIDDIKVIGAMGDSVTAGFNLKGLDGKPLIDLNSLTEHRGLNYANGQDPGANSLLTLAKTLNDQVVGGATGKHLIEVCYGPLCPVPELQHQPSDGANAAASGALVSNVVKQVDVLVKALKDLPIDYEQDFKLVDFLFGNNDQCLSCHDILGNTVLSGDQFEKEMRTAFESLRQRVPNLILNVHLQFNVSRIYELTRDIPHCQNIRRFGFFIECTCALVDIGDIGKINRQKMDMIASDYNQRLIKIYKEYQSLQDPSFNLVLDPLFQSVDIASLPKDSLSDVDCFHPNLKTHGLIATNTWNNLFLPFGQKSRKLDLNPIPYCPLPQDRIQ
ncbi:hypothetical protein EDD86DRAFT_191183 [Gorgonomyces haynaldii]|nr:hypothetical protein EDD86DRAFT_191183 [Gorgonomyces haynaldii]